MIQYKIKFGSFYGTVSTLIKLSAYLDVLELRTSHGLKRGTINILDYNNNYPILLYILYKESSFEESFGEKKKKKLSSGLDSPFLSLSLPLSLFAAYRAATPPTSKFVRCECFLHRSLFYFLFFFFALNQFLKLLFTID